MVPGLMLLKPLVILVLLDSECPPELSGMVLEEITLRV